ncbi:hypothetical protein GCM10027347_60010 [Larkinella harenae]
MGAVKVMVPVFAVQLDGVAVLVGAAGIAVAVTLMVLVAVAVVNETQPVNTLRITVLYVPGAKLSKIRFPAAPKVTPPSILHS